MPAVMPAMRPAAHSPTSCAGWRASAGELSDRLSRRYFALIESDAHALAT